MGVQPASFCAHCQKNCQAQLASACQPALLTCVHAVCAFRDAGSEACLAGNAQAHKALAPTEDTHSAERHDDCPCHSFDTASASASKTPSVPLPNATCSASNSQSQHLRIPPGLNTQGDVKCSRTRLKCLPALLQHALRCSIVNHKSRAQALTVACSPAASSISALVLIAQATATHGGHCRLVAVACRSLSSTVHHDKPDGARKHAVTRNIIEQEHATGMEAGEDGVESVAPMRKQLHTAMSSASAQIGTASSLVATGSALPHFPSHSSELAMFVQPAAERGSGTDDLGALLAGKGVNFSTVSNTA